MHILQIIHTVVQHIALALHPPDLLPHDPHRAHLRVAKGPRLRARHVRHLLQFHRFAFVGGGAAVAAEGEDGEVGAVAEAPALDGLSIVRIFGEGGGEKGRKGGGEGVLGINGNYLKW